MPHKVEAVGRIAGSVIAFLAPGAAVVGAAVTVASPGAEHITTGEWVTAGVAALVASAAVEAQVARRVRAEQSRRSRLDFERVTVAAAEPSPEPPRGG